jgi:hypothetical protein
MRWIVPSHSRRVITRIAARPPTITWMTMLLVPGSM